jgi:hypothetical protein
VCIAYGNLPWHNVLYWRLIDCCSLATVFHPVSWLVKVQTHNRRCGIQCMVSSGVLVLLRLGIEVPRIKPFMASEAVRAYLAGIPLWVLGSIFAAAIGALFLVFPSCQSRICDLPGAGRGKLPARGTLVRRRFWQSLRPCKRMHPLLPWQYIGAFESSVKQRCELFKLWGSPERLIDFTSLAGFLQSSSVFVGYSDPARKGEGMYVSQNYFTLQFRCLF